MNSFRSLVAEVTSVREQAAGKSRISHQLNIAWTLLNTNRICFYSRLHLQVFSITSQTPHPMLLRQCVSTLRILVRQLCQILRITVYHLRTYRDSVYQPARYSGGGDGRIGFQYIRFAASLPSNRKTATAQTKLAG